MTEAIIPLISLIALEVILGIDNIIFICFPGGYHSDENSAKKWGSRRSLNQFPA